MSVLELTSSLGSTASTGRNNSDEAKLPDIPVEHLDYGYIEKCKDYKELGDILRVLKSGKEGRWFDLENACEARMLELMPAKERKLYIAMHTEPSRQDVEQANADLDAFLSDISNKDQTLTSHRCEPENRGAIFDDDNETLGTCTKLAYPPVRNSSKEEPCGEIPMPTSRPMKLSSKANQSKKDRISGYDWRAWERFDVEEELKRLDEEERIERERIEKENEEAKRKRMNQRKQMEHDFNRLGLNVDLQSMNEASRAFLGRREKEKGNECFKAQEFEDAYLYFSRAILILGRTDATPYANRATAALKLGRFEQAENDCTEALEIDPEYVKAYGRRGMARHKRGKYLDAISDFEEALFRNPKNTELNKLLAESRRKYNELGGIGADRPDAPPRNIENKKETFTRIAIIEDDDSESEDGQQESALSDWKTFKRDGGKAFMEDDYEKAIECFNSALDQISNSEHVDKQERWDCLWHRAMCYDKLQKHELAIADCEEILENEPSNVKALLRKGLALEALQKYEESLDCACAVIRIDISHAAASACIERLMKKLNGKQGQSKDGETQEVAETPDRIVESTKRKGNDWFARGDFGKAVECYNQSLELDRDNIAVLSNRGAAFLKLGEYQKCVDDCTLGIGLAKERGETKLLLKLLYRRSEAFKHLEKHHNAMSDLEELLQVEPGNVKAKQSCRDIKNRLEVKAKEEKYQQELEHRKRLAQKAQEKVEETSLPVPKAMYEFEQAWSSLRNKPKARAGYVLSIPLDRLKRIFRVEMPENILMDIVECFSDSTTRELVSGASEETKSLLREMSQLKRFGTVVAFLSTKQKQSIKHLLDILDAENELRELYAV